MEATMEAVQKKVNLKTTGDAEVKEASLLFSHKDFVGIEIELNHDMAIAAYGDGNIPSIMLTASVFDYGIGQNQTRRFTKITFLDFSGFEIWAADYSAERLRVCLRKRA